jgi:uncharacterized damage-inducible protein DinB
MSRATIQRPQSDEHAEYYAKYIDRVPDGDLIAQLGAQAADTGNLLKGLSTDRADFAYGPGKWTVKQVLGHIIDAERVFGYRALRFARNDKTELPGFDENSYVENANFAQRTLADLVDEFQGVRASTIQFAKNLDAEALTRRGKASNSPFTVRALLYIIAGHERHHTALLRERYLSQ